MKLSLVNTYKSLIPFSIELPNFTVITGLNGAGKTQLLTAIKDKIVLAEENDSHKLESIKYVNPETLSPQKSKVITAEKSNTDKETLWKQLDRYQTMRLKNPNYKLQNIYGNKANVPQIQLLEEIAKNSGKSIENITQDELFYHYPLEAGISQTDVFYQNFSDLFKRYYDEFDYNRYCQYRHENLGESIAFLNEIDFIKKHGKAPWGFVNDIIKEANLDYHIHPPKTDRYSSFELKLFNNSSSAEIKFTDLSSGEKVLMSIAFALYNTTFGIDCPDLLLMDEPDASLHPSMSKQFLEVIQNIFVKQKGIKVIVTTHSPSTVALAPEESIFIVNKSGVKVEKSSKDKALKILTSGVPSFSVNYENRRQVFVESHNDVKFYEQIYNKLSSHLNPEISLTFISSGDTRTDKNGSKIANCSQVIDITKTLRKAGNNLVWGIIDYDNNNKTESFIKVIGDGNRYSIENYILDPLLVTILLLREKLISRDDLGLSSEENYTDFINFGSKKIQSLLSFYLEKVRHQVSPRNSDTTKVTLLNDIEINLPIWYLHHQGHSLENKILKAFPKLNGIKKNKEEALKMAIIDKVIDDVPSLISKDFLDAFLYVQK